MSFLRPGVPRLFSAIVAIALSAACGRGSSPETVVAASAQAAEIAKPTSPAPAAIRLSGTVEAIHARTLIVPRLAGQITPTLVITRLVKSGTMVKVGDLILELDPQDQVRNAMDRRAEVVDLDDQIQK